MFVADPSTKKTGDRGCPSALSCRDSVLKSLISSKEQILGYDPALLIMDLAPIKPNEHAPFHYIPTGSARWLGRTIWSQVL